MKHTENEYCHGKLEVLITTLPIYFLLPKVETKLLIIFTDSDLACIYQLNKLLTTVSLIFLYFTAVV